MNPVNDSAPATKADINKLERRVNNSIEVAVAQISGAVMKALENVAKKDNLKNLATKDDLNKLDHKVEKLSGDVSDIRRRVIDLERDTPTQKEVGDLKKFVGFPPKS